MRISEHQPQDVAAGVGQLLALLAQLDDLVSRCTRAQYRASPEGRSGIGSHVRHCLDHIQALLDGASYGVIDYDARRRGTPVEACRDAAKQHLYAIERRLRALDQTPGTALVRVRAVVDREGQAVLLHSSLARELQFVASHTIHHCALIARLAGDVGVEVVPAFGYAPSTPLLVPAGRCA
jgi:hypothetical protein